MLASRSLLCHLHDRSAEGDGAGEWREGTSPSRSRRTGRETLTSSGPHGSVVIVATSANARAGSAGAGVQHQARPTP